VTTGLVDVLKEPLNHPVVQMESGPRQTAKAPIPGNSGADSDVVNVPLPTSWG
jgi:hypothetical protein